MNYDDIRNLKDKQAVPSVSGKVTAIYNNNPTANQERVGIHPQDVVLEDESGDKMRMCIMNKGMHLPADAKGRTFTFECVMDEKGKPSGVYTNFYGTRKGVQIMKDGVISGDRSTQHKQRNEPGDEVKQVSMETKSTRPTIGDHQAALVEILKGMEVHLADTVFAQDADYLTRLATTVYIQICKEGLVKGREVVPQAIVQMSKTASNMVPAQAQRPTPKVSDAYIVGKAVKGELKASEVKELHATGSYNWESLYDQFEQQLIKDGYNADTIGEVYDNLKAISSKASGKFDNAEFCRTVLSDPATFIDSLNGEVKPAEYREKVNDPNDIPF